MSLITRKTYFVWDASHDWFRAVDVLIADVKSQHQLTEVPFVLFLGNCLRHAVLLWGVILLCP
jgi:hypothetical protein